MRYDLSFDDALTRALREAVAEVGADNGCIHLRSRDDTRLICQTITRSYRATHLAFGLDITEAEAAWTAAREGRPISIANAVGDRRVAWIARERFGLEAVHYEPLRSDPGEASFGVMICSYQHPHGWTEAEQVSAREGARRVARLFRERGRPTTGPSMDDRELRLRRMLEATEAAVAAVDRDLVIYEATHAAGDEGVPTLPELLQKGDRAADLSQGIADVLSGRLSRFRALVGYQGAYWQVRLVPISESPGGELDGVAVALEDASDLFEAKVELDRHRQAAAMGLITARVAHEYNNLLQALASALDEFRRKELPSEAFEALSEQVILRGARLSQELLAFSRPGQAGVEVRRPLEVVRGIWTLLESAVGRNHRLVLEERGEAPPIRIHAEQLGVVLINLCVNARDASPPGSRITVVVDRQALDGAEHAVLTVADEGSGMTPEVQARATEAFFTTKPSGLGTGLGLATARNVVEGYGGGVTIDSATGEGTRVTLRIPAVPPTERPSRGIRPASLIPMPPRPLVGTPGSAEPTTEDAGQERPLAGRRALVVDDEDGFRRWLVRILRREGVTVTDVATVGEARVAIDQVGPDGFDFALLDMILPDGSGATVYEALVWAGDDAPAGPPASSRTAVVVVSGYAEASEVQRITRDGHPVLSKPFQRAELLELLPRLLAVASGTE